MQIDWESDESHLILNPRLSTKEPYATWVKKYPLAGHIWLLTSGSFKQKLVALSKRAFLVSAAAVNQTIDAKASDIWLNPLPLFHVGGLSILARAHLSGSKVYHSKIGQNSKATITSLVPTQIYDLVENKITPPKSLRTAFVGGAHLNKSLHKKAKALGWPLLPCYGMTECCSQVSSGHPTMMLLPHISARVSLDGKLSLKSESLMTGYIIDGIWYLQEGWFETEDRVEIQDRKLKFLGRSQESIKVMGESVNIFRLSEMVEATAQHLDLPINFYLTNYQEKRKGSALKLVTSLSSNVIKKLLMHYHKRCLPFERIEKIEYVERIERTELGKIKKNSLA